MPEITVTLNQIDQTTAGEYQIRNHTGRIDRPEEKGGGNQGPMGGELLVASLGGCFLSNLIAAAKGRDLPIHDLNLTVCGVLEGAPPRFVKMTLTVHLAGLEKEALQKIVTIAERGCIVANTLKPCMEVAVSIA
jgi:putative redox protein